MFVCPGISPANEESASQDRKRKWNYGEEKALNRTGGEGLVVMLSRCKHSAVSFDIRFTVAVVQILLNLSRSCWHVVDAVVTD